MKSRESREMNIWIYSSNMFFVQGVSALVAEAFGKKKYAIHVFDEKQIMNIMPASDGMSRIFVFSDTKNPLLLFYLDLLFGGNVVAGSCGIDDVRALLRRGRKKQRCLVSHPQSFLSPREREIIACMKLRMTDDEIASRFKLSGKTVSTHRRNIRLKLGIRNRNELYKYLLGFKKKGYSWKMPGSLYSV